MTNRSQFFKDATGALAGVGFVGCGLLDAAQRFQQPSQQAGRPILGGTAAKLLGIAS